MAGAARPERRGAGEGAAVDRAAVLRRAEPRAMRGCSIHPSASSKAATTTAPGVARPMSSTRASGALTTPRRTPGTWPSRCPTTGPGWPGCYGGRQGFGAELDAFFAAPETGRKTARLPGVRSTRSSRPATCGWACSGQSTSPPTTSRSCTCSPGARTTQDDRARGDEPALRRAARSARGTRATRTTARCRRGSCSPLSGSTRRRSVPSLRARLAALRGR